MISACNKIRSSSAVLIHLILLHLIQIAYAEAVLGQDRPHAKGSTTKWRSTCSTFSCSTGTIKIEASSDTPCDGGCIDEICCRKIAKGMTLVRPFFGGDAADLLHSFDRWDKLPPCKLNANDRPVRNELPAGDLILYFARDINAPEQAPVRRLIEPILNRTFRDGRSAWRQCFNDLHVVGVRSFIQR